jgi:hypothetical protein
MRWKHAIMTDPEVPEKTGQRVDLLLKKYV